MEARKIRRRWLLQHRRYERIGLRMFSAAIRSAALQIPFEELNYWNYRTIIQAAVPSFSDTYLEFYTQIGSIHGQKAGEEINKEIELERKDFDIQFFLDQYRQFVQTYLAVNGGSRIRSVREELVKDLVKFIASRAGGPGTDIRTIARELHKHILSKGFYRWQIERIVRTETTAAANLGALQAGQTSGVQWQKVWISSNDSRTRRRPTSDFDHLQMDGVRIDKGEKFQVNGDFIEFPGDPNGQPGNVINCRCTVVVRAKRDRRGRIIFDRPRALQTSQ